MWTRVETGRSGDEVFRRDGEYRKVSPTARLEAATLKWLASQGLPVPEVIDVTDSWVVTREVVGRTAAEPWPRGAHQRVVDALADIAIALHHLPVEGCPFDRSLATVSPLARERADTGLVDLDDLDEERRGWSAAQLVAELDRALPEMIDRERLVVTHGDLCLPNVILDPDTVSVIALVDTARLGRADRYADVALMHRSLTSNDLNPQYSGQTGERFLHRLEHDEVDDDKLAFYRLIDEFF
jgi:kanamycin kinase/aminoglycoside 3'-phosphotransferase-2